jgi:hypothetical protein
MVFKTVRRARHRILANEAMRHAAYSISAALASLILLLLLGTQILGWAWLLLLPAITLAAGTYATWRNAPSAYRVAQQVDYNLKLADTLSTALFFAGHGGGGKAADDQRGDMRRAQWTQAERMAASVDPRRAIPIRMPRALYGTALLALAAGSLFALRYGLDRRLDLRAPLARIVQDKLGYTEARQAARENPAAHDPKRPEETGFSLDDSQQKSPGELDAAPDSALDTVGVPDVDNKTGSSRPQDSKLAQSTQLEGEQNQSEEPEGVSANPGNQQSADARKGPSAGKQGQGDDKQTSGNSSENSSLLGKFRDAMSSLMNRMRQPSGAKGAQQQAGAQNGGQQKSQSGNAGQNGKQGQQPGDGQQADAKDAQPGDDSETAQSAQSGSPGQSGQQPATKQPGSGIGRQDGSKDVKLAEQLAAMGKISEIIGKRAANVSGELTVEVENSNQQLRTPYAQRDAHHAQAGGEINRDEVPVALQAYVQQYFEQVRKQAAATEGAQRAKKRPEPPKPGL